MTSRIHATFAAVCATVAAAATPAAWADRITLNDTGMTQCQDRDANWSSECGRSGQDADHGRDVTDANPDNGVAGFSFTKVCNSGQMAGEGSCPNDPGQGSGPDDWGCTHDNVSHLTWEVKTKGGIHNYQWLYTNKGRRASDDPTDVAGLIEATNAEKLCGATNWRLPDVIELQSIVNYGIGVPDSSGVRPFIDGAFFPHTHRDQTWTRTRFVDDSKQAWFVSFYYGAAGPDKRLHRHAARLVHDDARTAAALSVGFAAYAKERFIPSIDGTEVTDTMTGLVWRRCAEGMAWNNVDQTCTGAATEFDWGRALDHAKANREAGWRIPNIKELVSIADRLRAHPAIDVLAFPNTPTDRFFLSSTPVSFYIGFVLVQVAWFSTGTAGKDFADGLALRLVRGGRK
jgi:hypothetical protein